MVQNIRAVKLVKLIDMVMEARADAVLLRIFAERIQPLGDAAHRIHIRENTVRADHVPNAKLRKKRKLRADPVKSHMSGPRPKSKRQQPRPQLRRRHPAVISGKLHAGIAGLRGMTELLLKRKLRAGIRIELDSDLHHSAVPRQSK